MDRQQEFVLRTLEERDIRFVRLWFTDVLGFLKSVAVAPAELEGAFAEGIGFDGSAIEGFARVYESDMLARPDPSTFQVLPWRDEAARARRGCSATSSCRTARRRTPIRGTCCAGRCDAPPTSASRSTRTPRSSSSCCATGRPPSDMLPAPIDSGGYFDQTPHDLGHDFRREAITMLERMGISVEFSHHEVAPGPAGDRPALRRRADDRRQHHDVPARRQGGRARAGRLRVVHAEAVHRPARLGDAHAPVAVRGRPQRVPRRERSVRSCRRSAGRSSPACCTHAAEITAVTNQWVNSYKRLWGGGEAPAYVCWGHNNRSALVRVPMYKPQQGQLDPRRDPLAGLGVQPLPRRSRCCSPPA